MNDLHASPAAPSPVPTISSTTRRLKRKLDASGIRWEFDWVLGKQVLISTPELDQRLRARNAVRDSAALHRRPAQPRPNLAEGARLVRGQPAPSANLPWSDQPPQSAQPPRPAQLPRQVTEERDTVERERSSDIRRKRDWTVERVLGRRGDRVKVAWKETITDRSVQTDEEGNRYIVNGGKRYFAADVLRVEDGTSEQPILRLSWPDAWISTTDLAHPEDLPNTSRRAGSVFAAGPSRDRIYLAPEDRETDYYPELRRDIIAADGVFTATGMQRRIDISHFLRKPVVRPVHFNVLRGTNFLRKEFVKAVLVHGSGEQVTRPCRRCRAGNGLFQGCVVDPGGWNNGACTNCVLAREPLTVQCCFHSGKRGFHGHRPPVIDIEDLDDSDTSSQAHLDNLDGTRALCQPRYDHLDDLGVFGQTPARSFVEDDEPGSLLPDYASSIGSPTVEQPSQFVLPLRPLRHTVFGELNATPAPPVTLSPQSSPMPNDVIDMMILGAFEGTSSPLRPYRHTTISGRGATPALSVVPSLQSSPQPEDMLMSGALVGTPPPRRRSASPATIFALPGRKRYDRQPSCDTTPAPKRPKPEIIDLTDDAEPQQCPTPPDHVAATIPQLGKERTVWANDKFSPGKLTSEHFLWLWRRCDKENQEAIEDKVQYFRWLSWSKNLPPFEYFLKGEGLKFINESVIPIVGQRAVVLDD